MKKTIALLQSLGFSQYESQVYTALLRQSNIAGYELAKQSGVPASKIYSILEKLVGKNLIQVLDTEPKKYIPQPPKEILSRLRNDYLDTIDQLDDKLDELYKQVDFADDHIWSLHDRNAIIRKVHDFINEAAQQIYLSVWDEEIDEIAGSLTSANQRGLKINVVHFGQKQLGIGIEYLHGREHKIRVQRGGRRIALIVDDRKVILGHFQEDGSSNAAWTTNKGLVLLAKDYIIHDIYTIRIAQKYGEDANDIFEIT